MKKAISKKTLALLLVLSMVVALFAGMAVTASAASASDFSFAISSALDNNTLTITVNVNAPSAAGSKLSAIFSNFYVGETQLYPPIGALGNNAVGTAISGDVVAATNPSNMVVLICSGPSETTGFAGGQISFNLTFDVTGLSISEGQTVTMVPGVMLAMWESTVYKGLHRVGI